MSDDYTLKPEDIGAEIPVPLTPARYTAWCKSLDHYPKDGGQMAYHCMGMAGETGEAIDKVKKLYRDLPPGEMFDPKPILIELGDALYYIARIADDCGATLQDVMDLNYEKLEDRKARGVLRGSGDNR